MINYNFVKNYQDLTIWEKDKKQETIKKASLSSKNISIQNIKDFLKKEKIFYYPGLSVTGITLLINLIGLPAYLNTLRLESLHQQFIFNFSELKSTNEEIENKIKDLENYYQLYVLGSPAYIFSHLLQKSIPKDVQVTEFLLDKDGFQLNVQAYTIETINEFIDEVLKWPIIKAETILVKNIIKQSNSSQFSSQFNSKPNKELFIFEISGKNNIIGLEDKISFYKDSYNYGLIDKIQRYINLTDITKNNMI